MQKQFFIIYLIPLTLSAYNLTDDARDTMHRLATNTHFLKSVNKENRDHATHSFVKIEHAVDTITAALKGELARDVHSLAHQCLTLCAQLKPHRIARWYAHHATDAHKRLQRLSKKATQAVSDNLSEHDQSCLQSIQSASDGLRSFIEPRLFQRGTWWQRTKHALRGGGNATANLATVGGTIVLLATVGGITYAVLTNKKDGPDLDSFATIELAARQEYTHQKEYLTEWTWKKLERIVKESIPSFDGKEIRQLTPPLENKEIYYREQITNRIRLLGYSFSDLYKQTLQAYKDSIIKQYHTVIRDRIMAELVSTTLPARDRMLELIKEMKERPLPIEIVRTIPKKVRELHLSLERRPDTVSHADLSYLLGWYIDNVPDPDGTSIGGITATSMTVGDPTPERATRDLASEDGSEDETREPDKLAPLAIPPHVLAGTVSAPSPTGSVSSSGSGGGA